mgnify:CR=1 FL=1
MADPASLFDTAPYTVTPPEPEQLTAGEKRRRRQQAQITAGLHPLSLVTSPIRLHPQSAGRTATKHVAADNPVRCGTCRWRQQVGGHARDFPKCLYGAPRYDNGNLSVARAPRYSAGPATDVAAWWPGCVDWEPVPPDDPGGPP